MDDDDSDSIFGDDDNSVWPVLTPGEEFSDEDVMEVMMCSISPTPESNTNNDGEVEILGFTEEKKVEDEEREDGELVSGPLNNVDVSKEDEEIEEIRAKTIAEGSELEKNSTSKVGVRVDLKDGEVKLKANSTSKEDDVVQDGEEIKEIRAETIAEGSKFEFNSSSKVEIRVDLKDKEVKMKSNSTSKDDDLMQVDEKIEESRADFAVKSSNSKVGEDDVEIEIVKEDEKNEEIRVNLAGKEMHLKSNSTSKYENFEKTRVNFPATSSKSEAKSTPNVQEDNMEIEPVKESDKKQESRANFATKEPKLKSKSTSKDEAVKLNEEIKVDSNLAAKSNSNAIEHNVKINIEKEDQISQNIRAYLAAKKLKSKSISTSTSKNEEAKESSKKQEISAAKSSKSKSKPKSKFDENCTTIMNTEECLIEMLKHMYVKDDDDDVDLVERVKRRGITFPRNRDFDSW